MNFITRVFTCTGLRIVVDCGIVLLINIAEYVGTDECNTLLRMVFTFVKKTTYDKILRFLNQTIMHQRKVHIYKADRTSYGKIYTIASL